MIKTKQLDPDKKELVHEVLLSRHMHLYDKKKKNKGMPYNMSFDGKIQETPSKGKL